MDAMQEEYPQIARRFWVRFGWTMLWLLTGIVVGLLIVYGLLLPLTGIGPGDRSLAIQKKLSEGFGNKPALVILGNSITVEGIDAEQVAQAAPGWSAYSFAINGCGLNEMVLLVPEIIKSHPGGLAMIVRPQELGEPEDMPLDKAYGYALSGLEIPSGEEPFRGLSEASLAALHASRLQAWWQFRTTPMASLTQTLRRFTTHIEPAKADEWVRPFQMHTSIDGPRLERHLRVVEESAHAALDSGNRDGLLLIERMTKEISASGVRPVLVAAPMHPAVQKPLEKFSAELRGDLTRLAQEYQGLFVDATEALAASDFSDGLHPNAEGREKLSALLGSSLDSVPPVTQ